MKIAIVTSIVGVTALVTVLLLSCESAVAQDSNQSAAGRSLPDGFQSVSFTCW